MNLLQCPWKPPRDPAILAALSHKPVPFEARKGQHDFCAKCRGVPQRRTLFSYQGRVITSQMVLDCGNPDCLAYVLEEGKDQAAFLVETGQARFE